jgi:ribosomal protein S18 acetylase RimI-like enzyme
MILEFVEKGTNRYEDIKNLIKEKCECTCRKAMNKMTVTEELQGSEFAIVSLTENPTITVGSEPRRGEKDWTTVGASEGCSERGEKELTTDVNIINKYILNGFIVCGIKGSNNDILHIKLLCCLKGLNLGSKLIHKVVEYAIEQGYKKISLNALYEDRLIEWYKKQGFKLTTNKYYNFEGKIKEREMEMII